MNFGLYGFLGLALYFVPAIVAKVRKKSNFVPILLTNIFFGWTVIGWIIALIWSTTVEKHGSQK